MAAKMSKREYNGLKAAIEQRIGQLEAERNGAIITFEAWEASIVKPLEEDEQLAYVAEWLERGDAINKLHDAIADEERELKHLESRWNTRNWTGSDWNSYALVAANID